MSDPFLGEIRMVGFTFAPYGWAMCQGQVMSISQNQALFSLFGTTYGGNGQTTFGLPDLRSRSPVGTGTGLGLSPIEPGDQGGEEAITLTMSQLPAHTHTATTTGGVSVTGPVAIPATATTTGEGAIPTTSTVLGPVGEGGRPGTLYSTAAPTTTLAPFNVTLTGPGPTVTNSVTGSSLPTPLRNPYLGLTCIVALQGVFPTRG